MDHWTGAQCAFAIKAFYINDDNYAAARRLFRRHFQINRNNPVPSEFGLRNWREQVRLKRKPPGKGGSICTPENIDTCFLITSSRNGDISWPAKSPDLSAFDCLLWGYSLSKIYAHRPQNFAEVKSGIGEEIAGVPVHILRGMVRSVRSRLEEWLLKGTGFLENVMFEK
jgi:hypothetical protein